MKYSVYLKDKPVGTACTETNGLYCCIRCSCQLPKDSLYRILLIGEQRQLDLGICVPQDNRFGITTKIPIKKLPEGELRFQAVANGNREEAIFLPVDPNEAFCHLDRLRTARLASRGEVVGVIFTEEAPDPQDSDRNP